MASQDEGSSNGFTITWRIENTSFLWQGAGEYISSPIFVAEPIERTKWSLRLYPRGYTTKSYVEFYLYRHEGGVQNIAIDYELSFLAADGSVLKTSREKKRQILNGQMAGFSYFETRTNVFVENSKFLPGDTLTAHCRMWRSHGCMEKYVECIARTHIAVTEANFVWKVEGLDTVPACQRITYPIKSDTETVLMNLSLFLSEYRFVCFELATPIQVKMSTIQISIIDMLGDPIECVNNEAFFNYHHKEEFATSVVLTNNLNGNNSGVFSSITLNCRLKFSTGIGQEQIETIRYGNVNLRTTLASSHAAVEETLSDLNSILKKNMRSLFDRDFASDVVLKTKTRSFFAHKSILGTHSPVFAAMFSSGMQESTCDRVDIQDLEDDTVQLMLQFMYTTGIDQLDWETARRLYAAADKYALLPLKKMSSIHLGTNLLPCNACQALHLADLHHDGDLKRTVQDFILHNSKEVMISEDWKLLVETSPKLAAETMRPTFKK